MSIAARVKLSQIIEDGGSLIFGEQRFSSAGRVVNGLGDINGDGIDDFAILAPDFDLADGTPSAGRAYIVFGQLGGFGNGFQLSSLDGTNGFTIDGLGDFDDLGDAVAGADINGDGFNDVIIGSELQDSDSGLRRTGSTFVYFGRETGFSNVSVDDLTGTEGFRMDGQFFGSGDLLGSDVDAIGDFNGDGIDDFIVGARLANGPGKGDIFNDDGKAHIVFGTTEGFPDLFTDADLDGSNGVTLLGFDDASFGDSVAGIGDVNGDGFDDVLIGAPFNDGDFGSDTSGIAAIVFGTDDALPATIDLSQLDGTDGFLMAGLNAGDTLGEGAAGIGDVNGDGVDDFMIGATGVIPPGFDGSNSEDGFGAVFVVFGTTDGFGPSFDVSTLDGTNGFSLTGLVEEAGLGGDIQGVGDFNGDGFNDIAIDGSNGEAYVIFGTDQGFDAAIDLTALDGLNGFVIQDDLRDRISLSGAGDYDGDGFDDLLIGGSSIDNGGTTFTGGAYIIYGGPVGERIFGDENPNALNGTIFNDVIDGLGDADTLIGGTGGDLYFLDSGRDRVIELVDEGFDQIIASFNIKGFSSNYDNVESFTLAGTADTAFGSDRDDEIFANATRRSFLEGRAGNDLLVGSDFNDRLDGGTGADQMRGGDGNDVYKVDDLGDRVIESSGEGIDLVRSKVDFVLGSEVENLQLVGSATSGTGSFRDNEIFATTSAVIIDGRGGDDRLTGSRFADTIIGGSGNDTVRAAAGNDAVSGGSGNDVLRGNGGADEVNGDDGDDIIFGGTGDDTLNGGDGRDTINGEGQNDMLDGGAGIDRLFGGLGDDIIIGGADRDVLFGDAGADTFVFDEAHFAGLAANSADRITDFKDFQGDLIDLSLVDAITGGNDDAFAFINEAEFSGTAGELRWEQDGANTMIYMDVDGDAQADFAIRLDGTLNLAEANFIL